MRRLSTGMEHLLTSDSIADAVVTYATLLARVESADTVVIPIVRDDGTPDTARMLLGPASQLTIVPDVSSEVPLPGATEVVRDLEARSSRLEPRSIAADPAPPHGDRPLFDDFE